MQKLFFSCFISLLFLASCNVDDVVIKGEFLNSEGEIAVIQKLSSTSVVSLDSVEIDDDGTFKLSIPEVVEPGFYKLGVGEDNYIVLLIDKGEKLEVTGNSLNLSQNYDVSGSKGSEELRTLNQVLQANFEQTDSLKKAFQVYQQSGTNMDSIIPVFDQIYKKMLQANRQFVIDFIGEHSTSLASLSAVQSLSPDVDIDVYNQVAENLAAVMPTSEYVKTFKAKLASINSVHQAATRTQIGSEAPEIALKTPEGNTIKLSDFRGKTTLIDFWASWCKPCRMENPNVLKVYNRFKDKGFEIYGVSLDKDHANWVQAIKQDNLTWKHGSELQFWQSSFVAVYNLEGIPMTYLIDENGIIIAKGLRGEELEQKLEEIFN
ncbi:redoxin domain-containing protein [Bacteroidota bacterium]